MSKKYFRLGDNYFNQYLQQSLTPGQRQDQDLLVKLGYEVQSEVHELRSRDGAQQIGYKVGCISETIQKSLAIDQPIFGRIYAEQAWDSGITLPLGDFDGLAIEGELAVRLKRPIAQISNESIATEAIKAVFPVIELHHYNFTEPLTAPKMIAQNAIHAGFVTCSQTEFSSAFPDLLEIHINDKQVAQIPGKECRALVLKSLPWLAHTLSKMRDNTKGLDTVLCGSIAPLFPLCKGGNIKVNTNNQVVECAVCAKVDSHSL